MLKRGRDSGKGSGNSNRSQQSTPVTTGWFFHNPSLDAPVNTFIFTIFAVIFGVLIMTFFLMQDPFSSIIFIIVLIVTIASMVLILVNLYSTFRKGTQTKWGNNYSTRILLSVESVKSRAEAALRRNNISYTTIADPDTTGYCAGSKYVIWIRTGLGIWIQKIAPWNLVRIILGPKTESNADIVEVARRALSKEFNIPE